MVHDEKQIVALALLKYGESLFGRLVLAERSTVVTDRNESVEKDVAGEEGLRLESRRHGRHTSYSTPESTLNGWHSVLWYFLDRNLRGSVSPVSDLTSF